MVLESSCAGVYTPVLCSVSPRTSSSAASLERSLLLLNKRLNAFTVSTANNSPAITTKAQDIWVLIFDINHSNLMNQNQVPINDPLIECFHYPNTVFAPIVRLSIADFWWDELLV